MCNPGGTGTAEGNAWSGGCHDCMHFAQYKRRWNCLLLHRSILTFILRPTKMQHGHSVENMAPTAAEMPQRHEMPTATPPNIDDVNGSETCSSDGSNSSAAVADSFGHRLFQLSLALSAVAICACAILIPVLIAELDGLTELADREGKVFKASKKMAFQLNLVIY